MQPIDRVVKDLDAGTIPCMTVAQIERDPL
jgi:hypothetical protein